MRPRLITLPLLASLVLVAFPCSAFTKQEYQIAVVGVGYTWCLYKSGLLTKAKAQQVGQRYMLSKGVDPAEIKSISKTQGFGGQVKRWIGSKGGCKRLAEVFLAAVKRRQSQPQKPRDSAPPTLRESLSDTPFVW